MAMNDGVRARFHVKDGVLTVLYAEPGSAYENLDDAQRADLIRRMTEFSEVQVDGVPTDGDMMICPACDPGYGLYVQIIGAVRFDHDDFRLLAECEGGHSVTIHFRSHAGHTTPWTEAEARP